MQFQKLATEIMKDRTSCRSFADKEVDEERLLKLEAAIKEIAEEAKINVRFLTIGYSG